jgi:ABC-type branched-subunit amino acid transport system substrate-binding protein
MKKWSSVVAIVILCLALVIGAACGEEEEEIREVKFGFAAPLSGILGAFVGLPAEQGIELAAEMIGEFTVAGDGYRWNVIYQDNEYTSAGGVASATKFIFEDGVKFMHQTGSDAALGSQPLCEEKGVILSISGAGMEAFGPDKPHTFQFSPTYMVHTPVLFQWLTTARPEVETVAIAMGDDRTGHEIADAAVTAAEYFDLEVVTVDHYPSSTMEFYPLATKLVSKEPDLFIGNPLLVASMKEMGWDGLAAFYGWNTETAEAAEWDNVQGFLVYQPNPFGEELPQAVKDFAAEYQARYDQEFTMSSYYPATILYVLTEALKQADTVDDVDKIMEVLETETFDTWIGPLRFGGQGLIGTDHLLMWPAPIAEIEDRDYHVIFEMSADEAETLAVEVYK